MRGGTAGHSIPGGLAGESDEVPGGLELAILVAQPLQLESQDRPSDRRQTSAKLRTNRSIDAPCGMIGARALPNLANNCLEKTDQCARIRGRHDPAGGRFRPMDDAMEKPIELDFVHDVQQLHREFQFLQFVEQTGSRFVLNVPRWF
jgi:hypothetical protein